MTAPAPATEPTLTGLLYRVANECDAAALRTADPELWKLLHRAAELNALVARHLEGRERLAKIEALVVLATAEGTGHV